jgi:hypothetical protein
MFECSCPAIAVLNKTIWERDQHFIAAKNLEAEIKEKYTIFNSKS